MSYKMIVESPSFMEENKLITFHSIKVEDEDEYLTWEQKNLCNNNIKNSKKRRLVITTTLEEPVLIEIRPNLVEHINQPLVCSSTQCEIIEKVCCKKDECLEHMNLWNELYQVIHDTNTLCFCEESWFEKQIAVGDSHVVEGNSMTCSKLWLKISFEALDKIMLLNQEISEEKERHNLVSLELSNLQRQAESEKNAHNQDCQKLEKEILELKNQNTSQVEEIRRLYIENLATVDDEDTLFLEIKCEVDESKQHMLEQKDQMAKELNDLNQYKKLCKDQEIQSENFAKNQVMSFVEKIEYDNLKLKVEILEKERLQYQENTTLASIVDGNRKDHMVDYATLLEERDNLKQELEKVNIDFHQTTSKLQDNVAKRRRLEAESEGEKQHRSNLAATLYEIENEVEETTSIINSLQSAAFESMAALMSDLQKFQESLDNNMICNNFETTLSTQSDDEMIKSIEREVNKSLDQNLEIANPKLFKGIPNTKSFVSKLTEGHKNLLNEISNVKKAIKLAIECHKCHVHIANKKMTSKLENIELERETFCWKTKVFEEENTRLQEDNLKLQQELSSFENANSKLTLQLKDLEKDSELTQESLKNLHEENRRLLKKAKWKSNGKQGGYQESLIVQAWEKKLQKLETDYNLLRHVKKDLVKEKHRLEDELERAIEKGYKRLGGNEDQKSEEELFNMTQERNKLRKIKITLAIENVSLKESLAQLRIQADALETKCETLSKWKEKVQILEEECEDLRDWKKKAEALEMECKDLHNIQMKVEVHEIGCQIKNFETKEFEENQKLQKDIKIVDKECQDIGLNKDCFEEECKSLYECKANLEKECQNLCQRIEFLEKDQDTLCMCKKKNKKSTQNNKCHDVDILEFGAFECGIDNLNESENKIEERNNILHQPNSTNIELCNIQHYKEIIANLEEENIKLCQNHQAALDKQWDVLQGDLKAFETKIAELENECESVRRDHLSSMVENAELIREKKKIITLYNDQKYNNEILETANECLQKNQEQKEADHMKERNNYYSSIDRLNQQITNLESTFSKRWHQQASNYKLSLASKAKFNGQETITLSCQEYEILLAEKAVMLQERDSAHKKLCSAEVQNLQLSATIECLRQEAPCSNQDCKEKQNDAEVLLAQDVINLQSMLSLQEEELEIITCERNKVLETNTSIRGEYDQLNGAFSQCQHENQRLEIEIEELNRRSSLEQIHSAASSLKEQLGKAFKEKDLIKEHLNRTIKEKEEITNIANEREKAIFSLKETIVKLEEKEKSTLKIQLQGSNDNVATQSQVKNKSMMVAKERDNMKEEIITLKNELASLNKKMLFTNGDLKNKTTLWQKERSNFEEKCQRLEIELMNTQEALAMIKKKMANDLQETIQENANLERVTNEEVKSAHEQVSQLQDELFRAKVSFDKKNELSTKELEYVMVEKNILSQEIIELKEKETLILVPKKLLDQGVQVKLQEKDLKFETKEIKNCEEKAIPILDHCFTLKENQVTKKDEINEPCAKELFFNQNLCDLETKTCLLENQLVDLNKENNKLTLAKQSLVCEKNHLFATIKKHEIEKETMFKNFEQDLNMEVFAVNALLATTTNEKEELVISKESLHMKLNDLSITVQSLNEQLEASSFEISCLVEAKEVITFEQDDCLKTISKIEKQLEKTITIVKKFIKKYANNDPSLSYKSLSSWKDHENLIAEIALLRKEKEDIANKLENVVEQSSNSLNDHKYALAKIQHDFHIEQEQRENLIKENMLLEEKNGNLVQTKDHFIHECQNLLVNMELVKEDNKETKRVFRKEMIQLTSLKNKLLEAISKKDQLVLNEYSLIQQSKKISQEKHQAELEGKITILHQTIENIVEERKSLVKKCKSHDQLQCDFLSLFESKINLSKERENLFKELTTLKLEKEKLDKEHHANLLEKNQISACEITLKVEVFDLNKKLHTLNEQVAKFFEENEILHAKLQGFSMKNAKTFVNQEQQTCVLDTIENGMLCSLEPINKFIAKFMIKDKFVEIMHLDVELESFNKELEFLKQHQGELVIEEDNVIAMLKDIEHVHACISMHKLEMETIKQKLDVFDKNYIQLVLERDNATQENEFLNQQCNMILVEISALTTKNENKSSPQKSKLRESLVHKEMSVIHQIKTLQMSMNVLEDHQTNLKKDNKSISLDNETLTKEKDGLIASISLLRKQHDTIIAQELKKKEVTTLEVNLQQKFEDLLENVNSLNKNHGYVGEKELIQHTTESLTKECDNLFATITLIKDEQTSPCSNAEHLHDAKMDQSIIVRKKELLKQEPLSKTKLNEFAKKTAILIKGFIAITKEREQLIVEMTSLKREYQKLHTRLVVVERDKDTLMKSVLESRSTIEHLAREISRLQRKLAEAEMKLAHNIVERDNANIQIADLQRLLNNHHRMQNLQAPYSMENFGTLESQNRCLRTAKDVMEEHLKKCSMELEGNYRFQQPDFKIQKIDPHPLPSPSFHTSSQLFLSGPDPLRRPRPPPPPPALPPMLHQQWPT